jgi:hypothetical protein
MHTLVIPSVYVLSPNLDLHELQSEFAQVKQFVIFAHWLQIILDYELDNP